jgi:hypothetical protein
MIVALLLALAPLQDPEGDVFEWARQLDELDLGWRWGKFQAEVSGLQDLEVFVFGDDAPGIAMEDPALRDGDYESDHWSDSPAVLARTALFLDMFYDDWLEASVELKFMGTTGADGDFAFLAEQYWIRAIAAPELKFELGKFAAPLGNFIPRSSSRKNPLTTWPLVYDLPTSLRGPGDSDNWLRIHRDDPDVKNWIVPVWREVYGTGAMVFGAHGDLSWQLAVQNSAPGTLMEDWDAEAFDPDFFAFYVHAAWQLDMTTQVGVSFTQGPYAKQRYANGAPGMTDVLNIEDFDQTMAGIDLAYSLGHLELFAEVYWCRFECQNIEDLELWTWYVEGKYTLLPGLWAAARVAQMSFSDITDVDGRFAWDRSVSRVELGGGYLFTDNFFVKLTGQLNYHAGGPEPDDHMLMLQVGLGF